MSGKTCMDLDLLRTLHSQGLHPDDMAKRLGFTPSAVIDQLSILGLGWKQKKHGMQKLTPEDEAGIIRRYSIDKLGANSVAAEFGVSKKTVYNVLNKHGVGTRSVASRRKDQSFEGRACRVTPFDKRVAEQHAKGLSPANIAKELGTYDATVRYSLRKQGLYQVGTDAQKIRQAVSTRTKGLGKGNREVPKDKDLRHDAFHGFSEEACYWAGFLAADGCIHQSAYGQPRIFLNLCQEDIGHLEKMRTFVNTSNAIVLSEHDAFGSEEKPYKTACLSWTSKYQASLLRELGILPHKEGRFVPDSLAMNPAYWRGLVDGDGCVYKPDAGTVYLSGQKAIIDGWETFCNFTAGRTDAIRVRSKPGVLVGSVRMKHDAATIIRKLYQGASIYLDRKYANARLWF